MPGRVVVQWDKEDCADMGIIKVDLLGLGMMAVIEDCLEADSANIYGEAVDLAHLPQDDPRSSPRCRKPTPSACSRWKAARRWPHCRACGRDRFYDIVVQVAIIRPGPIVGKMVHPYLEPAAGAGSAGLSASFARAGAAADAGRAAVSGAVAAHGDDRGRIHRRRGGGVAPRHGLQALRKAHGGNRGEAARRHGRATASPAKVQDDHRALHYLFRAVRISRIARRQLCAAGLCQRVFEVPLSGGLHLRHAEQPADGLLFARHPDQRCAAARAARVAGGYRAIGLGLRGVGRPPGLPFEQVGRPDAYPHLRLGLRVCQRAARASGAGDSAGAAERPFSSVDDLARRVPRAAQGRTQPAGGNRRTQFARQPASARRPVAGAARHPARWVRCWKRGREGAAIAARAHDYRRAAVGGLSVAPA